MSHTAPPSARCARSWAQRLALCAALCGLGACVTPRPVLDGEVAAHARSSEPFSSSSKRPAIASLTPASPWGEPAAEARRSRVESAGSSSIIELGFRFYSNHLTKVDGAKCEHRPTCSRYALEAVRKHGAVVGSWLTIDRLLRSNASSSLRSLPILKYHEGRPYFADPVDENDFFF